MTRAILTVGQFRAMLWMARSTFAMHQKRGTFRHLEARGAVGHFRYSADACREFCAARQTTYVRRSA